MRKPPRAHRVTLMLNDKEQKALDKYCERYKIANRSRFIREALMRTILKRIENDQPTLFD
ncbi:MAG: hypothetical protein IJS82_06300 [Paludibacteraceae bacterium]|nr:hypothetical protein [Paludibacteraceae bacterium]